MSTRQQSIRLLPVTWPTRQLIVILVNSSTETVMGRGVQGGMVSHFHSFLSDGHPKQALKSWEVKIDVHDHK